MKQWFILAGVLLGPSRHKPPPITPMVPLLNPARIMPDRHGGKLLQIHRPR